MAKMPKMAITPRTAPKAGKAGEVWWEVDVGMTGEVEVEVDAYVGTFTVTGTVIISTDPLLLIVTGTDVTTADGWVVMPSRSVWSGRTVEGEEADGVDAVA